MFDGWRVVAVSAFAQAVSIGTTFYAYGAFMKPLASEFGASRLWAWPPVQRCRSGAL